MLGQKATKVGTVIGAVEGAADVKVQALTLVPQVEVKFRRERTRLATVAEVTLAPTPNEVTREGGSRRIDVTCNVRGRDLGAVARDIEAAIGTVLTIPFALIGGVAAVFATVCPRSTCALQLIVERSACTRRRGAPLARDAWATRERPRLGWGPKRSEKSEPRE